MQTAEIIDLVQAAIPGAEVDVSAEGNHLNLRVVSEAFAGQRPVRRQQMVYGALNSLIADGTVHAVNMQTLTPDEAA